MLNICDFSYINKNNEHLFYFIINVYDNILHIGKCFQIVLLC